MYISKIRSCSAAAVLSATLSACGGGQSSGPAAAGAGFPLEEDYPAPQSASSFPTAGTRSMAEATGASTGYARASDDIENYGSGVMFAGQHVTQGIATLFGRTNGTSSLQIIGKLISPTQLEVLFEDEYYLLNWDEPTNSFRGTFEGSGSPKYTNIVARLDVKNRFAAIGQVFVRQDNGNFPGGFVHNGRRGESAEALFGFATDPAKLSGTATYTGTADLFVDNENPFFDRSDAATGLANLSLDFATGTLAGQAVFSDPVGDVYDNNTPDVSNQTLQISGSIAGNAVAVRVVASEGLPMGGTLTGGLFGPDGDALVAYGDVSGSFSNGFASQTFDGTLELDAMRN